MFGDDIEGEEDDEEEEDEEMEDVTAGVGGEGSIEGGKRKARSEEHTSELQSQ